MPRGKSTWNEALNQFNKGKDHYIIPRKGSKEYEEVKKIQVTLQPVANEPVVQTE